jgi:hypothetical protein
LNEAFCHDGGPRALNAKGGQNGTAIAKALEISLLVNIIYIIIIIERAISS